MLEAFETTSVHMERLLLVIVQTPVEDVERIINEVTRFTPLSMGENYDRNAFVSAEGIERYRPRRGAVAGVEEDTRQRPGIVNIRIEVPYDMQLAASLVEAIFQVHSYQEPLIRIEPVLSARSKGLDDKSNPNRWWNRDGDWKKKKV